MQMNMLKKAFYPEADVACGQRRRHERAKPSIVLAD
jgi:hypothetical protein